MANSTIYPYGVGGQTPSGINIVNDLVTGGATDALSAEAGATLKELVDSHVALKGTMEQALTFYQSHSNPFQWVLVETDTNNVTTTKTIWHIGDGVFVDAFGAVVSDNS